MECRFEGCERKMRSRGLCNTHYEQQRKGLPLQPIAVVRNVGKVCSFHGCERAAKVKGLCRAHYQQKRQGLALKPLRPKRKKTEAPASCSFHGCGRAAISKGLCGGHYQQKRQGRVLKPLRPRRKKTEAPASCSFPGCTRVTKSKGLCRSHYSQKRRTGSLKPLRPIGTPNEVIVCDDGSCALILTDKKGNEKTRTFIDRDQLERVKPFRWYSVRGYVEAKLSSRKCLRLHRFLAAPEPDMEVDHIDGNPLNNRMSNLRVVTHAESGQNRKTSRASTTGHRNVQRVNSGRYAGSFRVVVMKAGKQHYGGHYKNIEEAAAKAEKLRAALFTHHNEQRN